MKSTDIVFINFWLLKISIDGITVGEVVGDQQNCLSVNNSKSHADNERQILTITVDEQLEAFRIYEFNIPFVSNVDTVLTRLYQRRYLDADTRYEK